MMFNRFYFTYFFSIPWSKEKNILSLMLKFNFESNVGCLVYKGVEWGLGILLLRQYEKRNALIPLKKNTPSSWMQLKCLRF